jgi:hypothetical protein
MNREEALKICDLEFDSILSKLQTVDKNFKVLPKKEDYRIFVEEGGYAKGVIIKFGSAFVVSHEELKRCNNPQHLINLLDAKRRHMFLSIADMFSNLAEKIEVL